VTDEELKEPVASLAAAQKETDRQLKETDRHLNEFRRTQSEANQELRRQLGGLGNNFSYKLYGVLAAVDSSKEMDAGQGAMSQGAQFPHDLCQQARGDSNPLFKPGDKNPIQMRQVLRRRLRRAPQMRRLDQGDDCGADDSGRLSRGRFFIAQGRSARRPNERSVLSRAGPLHDASGGAQWSWPAPLG
jgi:hypothetical protein